MLHPLPCALALASLASLPWLVADCRAADLSLALDDATLDDKNPTRFGHRMAVGDLDGDAIPDLVVGAPSGDGAVHVFFGPVDRDRTAVEADASFVGAHGQAAGMAVAVADVNGDGKQDLVIGAAATGSAPGEVLVVQGPLAAGQLYGAGDVDRIVRGSAPGSQFGWALATGDLDGDGRIDVVVGACGERGGNGASWILRDVPPGVTDLALNVPTQFVHVVSGGRSGCAFLATGDFNGDGYDDAAISAHGSSVGAANYSGEVGLVFGSASLPGELVLSQQRADQYPDMTTFIATGSNQTFGRAVSMGDVNGDGYADLLIGAPESECAFGLTSLGQCTHPAEGAAYLVLGAPDANGRRPLRDVVRVRDVARLSWVGPTPDAQLGFSVAILGDVIAEPPQGGGWISVPRREVLLGSVNGYAYLDAYPAGTWERVSYRCPDGLACTGPYLTSPGTPEPTLRREARALNKVKVRYVGESPSHLAGSSVFDPGDIDGDGRDDIGIGASGQLLRATPVLAAGRVHLVSGR